MAIVLDGTSGITTPALDSTARFASADMPLGSVLQVVSTTKTNVFSTSSASFVDITGFSATITPTSATSKIFVVVSMGLIGAVGGYMGSFALVRGATNLGFGNALGSAKQVTFNSYGLSFDANSSTNAGYSYLDSPSTTSSTTYKVQVCQANTTVTQTLYINSTSSTANTYNQTGSSTITLMEIAG